nr:MAG TPA: hypothetical protein [Caudoviricetes sp.]
MGLLDLNQKENEVGTGNQVDAMAVIDILAMEVASLTKRVAIAEAKVIDFESKMKESK